MTTIMHLMISGARVKTVPPQTVGDYIPASTRAAKEEGMPKPSMPLQLDRGHNPPSMEAATAVVMITV